MALNSWTLGTAVRVGITFSVASVNTNPTTTSLLVEDPSGNIATYTYEAAEITRTATGIFYYDILLDESGIWQYRWVGTGAAAVVKQNEIHCKRSYAITE